jgi:hypothetical protein
LVAACKSRYAIAEDSCKEKINCSKDNAAPLPCQEACHPPRGPANMVFMLVMQSRIQIIIRSGFAAASQFPILQICITICPIGRAKSRQFYKPAWMEPLIFRLLELWSFPTLGVDFHISGIANILEKPVYLIKILI